MTSTAMSRAVNSYLTGYRGSRLERNFLAANLRPSVIKYVNSSWAERYLNPAPLYISSTPALTWGSGTYVTPLVFPLSSALYGRVGLVCLFDPAGWRIFDAVSPRGRFIYQQWARAQPDFPDLVLTVHSTMTNHALRNRFRQQFKIDCVLFRPDQAADLHTDVNAHFWMLVTDWSNGHINAGGPSARFPDAKFSVLIDEDFSATREWNLPVLKSSRTIETATEARIGNVGMSIKTARSDPKLGSVVLQQFYNNAFAHLWIEP